MFGMNPQQMLMQQMQNAGSSQGFDIFQTLRQSTNPRQVLMQQMQNLSYANPQMSQVMQMVQGKTGSQLQQLAQNLYANQGMDYNTFQANAQQKLGL